MLHENQGYDCDGGSVEGDGEAIRSSETVRWVSQLGKLCKRRPALRLVELYINFGTYRSSLESPHSILRSTMSQFPETIKAITYSKTGNIDVIEKTDQPFPKQGPGDVILKVRETVGRPLRLTRAYLLVIMHVGRIRWCEFHRHLLQGWALPLPSPRNRWIGGRRSDRRTPYRPRGIESPRVQGKGLCNRSQCHRCACDIQCFNFSTDYLILSTQNLRGTDAEYISIPWEKIFPIPPESGIDTRTGAAGFIQATTVLAFMNEAYEVKKGDTILIHTVAGGFGLIAAQYAKFKGATVIGTTSTNSKAELAKAHGADHVILYTKEDTVQRVLEITNGVGVEAVFDGVGRDTYVFFFSSSLDFCCGRRTDPYDQIRQQFQAVEEERNPRFLWKCFRRCPAVLDLQTCGEKRQATSPSRDELHGHP